MVWSHPLVTTLLVAAHGDVISLSCSQRQVLCKQCTAVGCTVWCWAAEQPPCSLIDVLSDRACVATELMFACPTPEYLRLFCWRHRTSFVCWKINVAVRNISNRHCHSRMIKMHKLIFSSKNEKRTFCCDKWYNFCLHEQMIKSCNRKTVKSWLK